MIWQDDEDDMASYASSISHTTSRSVRTAVSQSQRSRASFATGRGHGVGSGSSRRSRKKDKSLKAVDRPILVLVDSRTRQSRDYDDIQEGTSIMIRKGTVVKASYKKGDWIRILEGHWLPIRSPAPAPGIKAKRVTYLRYVRALRARCMSTIWWWLLLH